ncbi:MAG TPA: DUF2961 domain-containing protein, partial [Planctomycetota bacterium]|nr:DUF2961 domain-containing protein [Planctomycetota bacterium]
PKPHLHTWERIDAGRGHWPHATPRLPRTQTLAIAGGGGVAVIALTGPSTLLELTCKVRVPDDWRKLRVRCFWDGQSQPAVDAPLRLLGALIEPPFRFPVRSLLLANDGDVRISNWFPMHFDRSARLEFINDNAQAVDLEVTLALGDGPHPQPWGYFNAVYRAGVTGTGEPFFGPQFDDARGTLRLLMLEDALDNSGRIPDQLLTHLEGDLCIRVNGTRGSDHNFDATETSIGRWGWYLSPADRPFDSDTSFQSSIQIDYQPGGGRDARRIQGSTFVFDPVHFCSGIDMLLEHGVQNTSNADYRLLAFLYVEPGAARRVLQEIDIGSLPSEQQFQVQFTEWSHTTLSGPCSRDQFFGTGDVTDTLRQVRDFLRFRVTRTSDPSAQRPIGFGCRLDRSGTMATGVCQADVLVNGQPAGLLHCATHSALYPWKEGGEVEVELPRALTDGLPTFTVELRPRAGADPLRLARVWVYEYLK